MDRGQARRKALGVSPPDPTARRSTVPATPTPIDRLARLGAWCFAHRRRVLAGWVAALALALAVLAPLAGSFQADFRTPGSDSAAADRVLQERFPDRSSMTIDVVWHAAAGARSAPVQARIGRLLAAAGRLEGIGAATAPEVSRDGRTAVARLQIDAARDSDVPRATGERLIELAHAASGDGLQVAMAGWAIGNAQESEVSPEVVGFAIAAVVLLLTFGSLLAAGLPLLTALLGLGIGTTLVGTLAAVVDVPEFAPAVAGMMAIGVGIDYALLVITRYRAALAAGSDPGDAVAEATSTAGRSVLVAGLTVVVALLGLFAMRLPFLNGVALSASLAVLVAACAAVTLLPALLGFVGRRIDALHVPGSRARVGNGRPSRWIAYSRAIQRRPRAAALAGVLTIAVLALPLTDFRLGFPDAGNDPETTMTRQAYDLVAAGFGPGASGPLLLTAELPPVDPVDGARSLALLRERVRALPGVVSVTPPRPNADGDAALLMAIPATSPQDAATQRVVDRLRDEVAPQVARATGLTVHVGGATASIVDQSEYTLARLPLFIGAVVSLSFLLLLAAFRSLPVALKAGVMNLLSIGAAYGVVALVADGGWAGQLVGIDTPTPVPPFIPVMMFAILFGLSMDYEVFLLSRIREEFLAHGDNARAVADGLAKTARVITAAAAIMIAVFSSFALSADVVLKLMGIGMATAILVDATVVRMVLVPAIMQLLGRANWWLPGWLDRLLPAARPLPAIAAARAD
jgi:RND superfamily putative drug exporter